MSEDTSENPDLPSDPKELLRTTLEAADEPNEKVFKNAMAEEVEVMQERFPDKMDRGAIWQDLQRERNAFPDLTHNIKQIWQDGRMLFATYTATGTFEGELRLGEDAVFEPNGNEMAQRGIVMARVENGRITGWAYFAELLPVFQDLDIIPSFAELAE